MKSPRILVASAAVLVSSFSAHAVNLTWDLTSGDGAAITPGSGTWNTTGTNVAWTSGNSAIFGGTDGTYAITLGSAISANNLVFNNSGYTLSAATPQSLSLTTSSVAITSGKTATIGTNVTLTRTGAYTIT